MARQQVAWVLLALTACQDELPREPMFELPTAATVLQPEDGGPFEEPIGFVASGHGGRIGILALKQGRFLTDDPTAAFLRTNPLATGGARRLTSVGAWSPDPGTVTVFAGDRAFNQLLEIPYIVELDADGAPVEQTTSLGEVTFVDADDSGDSPTLTDLTIKQGYTSTESWSVSYDGSRWWVKGTRSGKQENPAVTGEPYVGDSRNVNFTIEGEATAGDRFEFSTDSGLIEHDVGGAVEAIGVLPDMSRIALVVANEDGQVFRWYDPATGATTDVALGAGALPLRFDVMEDGRVFVADGALPTLWEISGDTVTAHPLPWPILDAAVLEGEVGRRAFLARADANEVWILDLDTDQFVDVNITRPGIQPMDFRAPVRGLSALRHPYLYPEADPDGVRRYGRSVAVSLQSGRLVFMEEESGCLVQDRLGPRTQVQGNFGVSGDFDTNFESSQLAPFLEANAINGRHVVVSDCGGIAKSETWTLRFSRTMQGWEVEGNVIGPQQSVAYPDERYLSDGGEVSFTPRAGVNPAQDGWTIAFGVIEGALSVDGDNNNDDAQDVSLSMPGDPVYFHYRVGPDDNGWRLVDERPFVLAFAEGADLAGRVNPSNGDVEVVWE